VSCQKDFPSVDRRPSGPAQVHRRSVRLGQEEPTARPDPVQSRPPWGGEDSIAQHHEPPRPTDSAPQSRLLGRTLDSRHPCPTNPQVQFSDVVKRRTTPRSCLHFTQCCTPHVPPRRMNSGYPVCAAPRRSATRRSSPVRPWVGVSVRSVRPSVSLLPWPNPRCSTTPTTAPRHWSDQRKAVS